MKEVISKKIIPYLIVTIALVVIFFAASMNMSEKKEYTPRIIILGDSVMAGATQSRSIADIYSEKYDDDCMSAAFGGSSLANTGKRGQYADVRNLISGVNIVASLRNGDFSAQKAVEIKGYGMDYFPELFARLEKTDITKTDIAVLGFGINDLGAGVKIDSDSGKYDTSTYKGAMRMAVSHLRAINPDIQIILVSPTHIWYNNKQLDCCDYEVDGISHQDMVVATRQIADELGASFLDLFEITKDYDDPDILTNDGVHPNDAGQELICESLHSLIESLN